MDRHFTKEFNRINLDKIKDSPGIYAFWFNNRCIYVGKTENQSLKKRLIQHYNDCHNNELKLWIRVYGKDLKFCTLELRTELQRKKIDQLERKFIYRLQPLANKQLKQLTNKKLRRE